MKWLIQVDERMPSKKKKQKTIPVGFTIDIAAERAGYGDEYDNTDQQHRGGNSQVLPVKQLDDDFEGEPEDGEEYLWLVRQEAAGCPDIVTDSSLTVVENFIQAKVEAKPKNVAVPDEQWRDAFVVSFKNARYNIANAGTLSDPLDDAFLPLPVWNDGHAARVYIFGKKSKGSKKPLADDASVSSLDSETVSATERPPTTTLLHNIGFRDQLLLVEHFEQWLQDRITTFHTQSLPSTILIPPHLRRKLANTTAPAVRLPTIIGKLEAQWLFALLTFLPSTMTSNDISTLRSLARTLRSIIDSLNAPTRRGVQPHQQVEEEKASCWMLIAAIWGIWEQRDLWD